MHYENVELHNVSEAEKLPGVPGVMLRRIPKAIRHALNPRGRFIAGMSSGCEVRFVCDAPDVRVTLFCADGDGEVLICRGDFVHSKQTILLGMLRTLQFDRHPRFETRRPEVLQRGFSPDVWRLIFNRSEMAFVAVDGLGREVRPPTAAEKPKRRLLAHGSSITHSNFETGYPHVAARLLGYDVFNLGLSGSCHAEPEMADFIAGRDGWDLATLELGVNMRGKYSPEQFHQRAAYMIRQITAAHPAKPVAVLTHFPNGSTHAAAEEEGTRAERAFDQSLRDIVRELRRPNLHLIEGTAVLDRFDLLTADLLHPSAVGQAIMGVNLARLLAEIDK